jgi:prepilin-type N-terminal cleavage/methylation domain-containing protein
VVKDQRGFSLVEIVIAITILATLSILIGTATSRALKAKRKIQAEVSDASALRDTLKVIRADINQAYNHYDFEKEIMDTATKPDAPKPPAAGQNPFVPVTQPQSQQPKRENKREDPRTHFIGEAEKINFVTMNQARMLTGELTADFMEIGYFVKPCRSLSKVDVSSNCLYRRSQKIIDNDVTEGGIETAILEHVTEFSLKYLGEGKTDWKTDWKTKGGIDTTTANQFPEAVEVNLATETELDGKKKQYSLQAIVPLHFPNNIKSKSTSNSLPGLPNSTFGAPTNDGTPTQ